MVVYADTSFLASIYLVQPESTRALAHMQDQKIPFPFTPFLRHELRNAIRLGVFRKEINSDICRRALREIENDLAENILAHAPIAWTDALQKTEDLGSLHSESMGIRSSDLFHIACAQQLKAETFLTFDERQRAVAGKVGFKTRF